MLKIIKYHQKYINDWNKFVTLSNNGTIFHNKKFISYHIDRKFTDHSLMLYWDNILVALFPAVIHNNFVVFSHPGASHGGLVIKDPLAFSILNNIIIAIDKYFKLLGYKSIFIVNTPKIYYEKPHDSIDYLLQWNGYNQKEIYISHAVDLSIKKIDLLLNKRKQRYMKNQKQNIKFISSVSFEAFYNLLAINKKKYSSSPTHSLQELITLNSLFNRKIKLFVSMFNDTVVGGSLLFYLNKKVCLIFYNVVSEKYRKTQLSTFQFFNCMKIAKNKGFQMIDFGVSHEPEMKNPLTPKLSLIKFKEQFGAFGVTRTCYEKEL